MGWRTMPMVSRFADIAIDDDKLSRWNIIIYVLNNTIRVHDPHVLYTITKHTHTHVYANGIKIVDEKYKITETIQCTSVCATSVKAVIASHPLDVVIPAFAFMSARGTYVHAHLRACALLQQVGMRVIQRFQRNPRTNG
jgi:hypothetical protein